MRSIRLVLFLLIGALGFAGASSWAHAQEVTVYPPMGPCDGLPQGFTFQFEGDYDVGPYEACDITGLTDLGDYAPVCPISTMEFDMHLGGCYFLEELPGDETTGGHQPWRDGQRGHCESWMDGYACSLWQEGYNFPDENGECPSETTLIPGDASGLGVATCQTFNEEDGEGTTINTDNDESITITGNGSETDTILVLPNTGINAIQHDNNLAFLALIATILAGIGCTIRYGRLT